MKKLNKKRLCLYTPPLPGNTSMLDTIELAEMLGLGGIELMNFCRELKTPDIDGAARLFNAAKEKDLYVPCLTVNSDIPTSPNEAAETLKKYADICSALGIKYLHHTIAKDFHCYDISDIEINRRFEVCIPAVKQVCEYANSINVSILTENQGFVFNGVSNMRRLYERTGGKIGFIADTGNTLFLDEKPEKFIKEFKNNVYHVHIKDYKIAGGDDPDEPIYISRGGMHFTDAEIGTGIIPLDRVINTLNDINYRGMFSLEFNGVKDCEEIKRVLKRITE